jgi:hypothetical protein
VFLEGHILFFTLLLHVVEGHVGLARKNNSSWDKVALAELRVVPGTLWPSFLSWRLRSRLISNKNLLKYHTTMRITQYYPSLNSDSPYQCIDFYHNGDKTWRWWLVECDVTCILCNCVIKTFWKFLLNFVWKKKKKKSLFPLYFFAVVKW